MAELPTVQLNPASTIPLYRQLADFVSSCVLSGSLRVGDRLPATRELAGQLGLNRTTVSAAYSLLEQNGLLEGQVGRGSFIAAPQAAISRSEMRSPQISFANSRPSETDFPLAEFRRLTKEVIDGDSAVDILQLGSAHGYAPLRRYLLDESVDAGIARPDDSVLVTNGCQQALDLLARLYGPGQRVGLEDPSYHGAVRVFTRAGAEIVAIPVDSDGLEVEGLASLLDRKRPQLLVVTPNFQNPTGTTLSLDRRKKLVELAAQYRCILVENDIYGDLRYTGTQLPTLKQIDTAGNVILLRSYSKISFPGLRVGWSVGPRQTIARLAEVKEMSDLHSDQLSQAVLLRFAESGELAKHVARTNKAGAARLEAALRTCAGSLPPGSRWTQPEGGMNLWIELPAPLDAEALLPVAQAAGVTFTPGRMFATERPQPNALRVSFGGLNVSDIESGLAILGRIARAEWDRLRLAERPKTDFEPAAALV